MSSNVDFEKIYLNQSKFSGRMRIAESGLGWKASSSTTGGSAAKTQPFLLPSEEISATQWSRGSRGYELKVQTKNQGVVILDGFDQNDFNDLKNQMQRKFKVNLEHREHSLRGWNWGKTDFARNELIFQIQNKPSFEIPYKQISNSNLMGKNEVAVELNVSDDKNRAGDEVMEVRLYIPGTVPKDDENEKSDEETEEQSAATVFYEQLKERAEIGQVAGEAIVSFSDILLLTPRGRYDIDMYPTSLRLRGKTYDYKIQYRQIERIFSLPKPDETHHLVILQIDPPIRQGQTRYPFLTLQFAKEEEIEVELNVEDEEFEQKYKDRLKKKYDTQTHLVISHVFKGLSERRVVVPGTFNSKYSQPGISCSLKASEGYLYPLDKCFLFVTKPTVYIPFNNVSNITMSRTGSSVTSSRTFDLEINLKSTGSHLFSNINKEEQESIEFFCKEKGLKVKNDEKLAKQFLNSAMNEASDSDDSDVVMGSNDEDESDDGDFNGGSESDVAEEFDSDAPSSSDEDDEGAASGDEAPPKKKSKN